VHGNDLAASVVAKAAHIKRFYKGVVYTRGESDALIAVGSRFARRDLHREVVVHGVAAEKAKTLESVVDRCARSKVRPLVLDVSVA
jgi:hypothetical protein